MEEIESRKYVCLEIHEANFFTETQRSVLTSWGMKLSLVPRDIRSRREMLFYEKYFFSQESNSCYSKVGTLFNIPTCS